MKQNKTRNIKVTDTTLETLPVQVAETVEVNLPVMEQAPETCPAWLTAEVVAKWFPTTPKVSTKKLYALMADGAQIGPLMVSEESEYAGQAVGCARPDLKLSIIEQGNGKVWKVPTPRPARVDSLKANGIKLVVEYKIADLVVAPVPVEVAA